MFPRHIIEYLLNQICFKRFYDDSTLELNKNKIKIVMEEKPNFVTKRNQCEKAEGASSPQIVVVYHQTMLLNRIIEAYQKCGSRTVEAA